MDTYEQNSSVRATARDLEVKRAGSSLSVSGGAGSSRKGRLRVCSALGEGFSCPCRVADRRTFILRLETKRADAIPVLRAILKTLLRRHAFRCVDCREERAS